jgi:serine/threonine protein kinase
VPYALKVPSIDLRDDPEYLRRLLMEEWIARRLSSPHVLKSGPARARSHLYVVTEYLEGQTLRQWMRDNPKPDLETVRGIVEQIVKGVRALHRREMLHQDLRPENVMIDQDGTVKIIDFGSTRVAGVLEGGSAIDDTEILGTAQYTAPEYFVSDETGPRSDLFSLGVVTYEMLTGQLPYGAQVSRATTVRAQSRLRYNSAPIQSAGIASWVDVALARATDPNPHRRYAAMSEFIADLRRPSATFDPNARVPLMQRNPLVFWQMLSLILGLLWLATLGWFWG